MKARRNALASFCVEMSSLPTSLRSTRGLSSNSSTAKYSTFLNSLPIVFDESVQSDQELMIRKHKTRSETLINCFQIYKKLNGNEQVPTEFVTPDESDVWPKETLGLKLGNAVNSSRKEKSFKYTRDELAEVGFKFNAQRVNGYELVKLALIRYKEIHGDMLVPAAFIIPNNSPEWRDETWGIRLGVKVNSTRGGKSFKDKRADLIRIGFDFNPQCISYGYDLVKAALILYKELNNDMLVPASFVIPELCDAWPQHMWGMRLGRCVSSTRNGNSFKDKREELVTIGFDFETQKNAHGFELLKAALLQYKNMNGDMLVPYSFVIPMNCSKWTVESWGMRLGEAVSNIRGRGSLKDHKEELIRIGFDYNRQKKIFGYDLVKQALLRYKEINGNLKVPYSFVINNSYDIYPERTLGMNLGGAVKAIRCGTRYRNKREDLISIGLTIPVFDTHNDRYNFKSTSLLLHSGEKSPKQQDQKLISEIKEISNHLERMEMPILTVPHLHPLSSEVKMSPSITISEPRRYYKCESYP